MNVVCGVIRHPGSIVADATGENDRADPWVDGLWKINATTGFPVAERLLSLAQMPLRGRRISTF